MLETHWDSWQHSAAPPSRDEECLLYGHPGLPVRELPLTLLPFAVVLGTWIQEVK